MSIIILDLDNCIADDSWRIPKINWETENLFDRYHSYHSLSGSDNAHNHDLYRNTGCDIVIFTARPAIYRTITEAWLLRHGIGHNILMMREMEDHSPSVELKHKQMMSLLNNTGIKIRDIVGAFDDRPDVVAMYSAFDIPAEVRAIHSLCAYTKPKEIKNADSRQSNGADVGDIQGAWQGIQGELFDDRGNPIYYVPRGYNT